jgi:hypothetical protein
MVPLSDLVDTRDEQESEEDRRLLKRTPADPWVRAYVMNRDYLMREKNQERASSWTDDAGRDPSRGAEQTNGVVASDGRRTNITSPGDNAARKPVPDPLSDAGIRSAKMWTGHTNRSYERRNIPAMLEKRRSIGSGAGGGHHMSSRSSIAELVHMLHTSDVKDSKVSEYERIFTSHGEKDSTGQAPVGRDFIGARRVIDSVFLFVHGPVTYWSCHIFEQRT